jgi:hypothetical protein
MRPPISAHERDTSGLGEVDAQLLAGRATTGIAVHSSLTRVDVPLDGRRSERREGGVSLNRALDVIAPLVTASAEWVSEDGYVERQTFVPSAGARHPFTALILHRADDAPHRAWAVSPSLAPQRFEVTQHEAGTQAVLRAVADALRMPDAPATLVVLLARLRRTLVKYPDGQSLVWRDAGVFLGTAHLLAASTSIYSSIVGIAETTQFPLEGTPDSLVDVGALVLSEKEQL